MRCVLGLLSSLGLLSITAQVAVMVWLTHRTETQARETMPGAHRLVVDERLTVLPLAVRDHAHWTLAHDWMPRRDAAAPYDNIGSAATASDLFDRVFVLSSEGVPLHVSGPSGATEASASVDAQGLAPLVRALRATPPGDHAASPSLARSDAAMSWAKKRAVDTPAFHGSLH